MRVNAEDFMTDSSGVMADRELKDMLDKNPTVINFDNIDMMFISAFQKLKAWLKLNPDVMYENVNESLQSDFDDMNEYIDEWFPTIIYYWS